MKILTLTFLLFADLALAHAPDSDATLVEAARHLWLGGHHLPLTVLVFAAAAALVCALRRRRRRMRTRR